ncbi:threonine dehydratase [Longimycelium tulufanense]|uniref:Threonine dehydratase n=1 Tax=Longimycelium tulufanense TaxID=907463 RepID=A0A8J3CCD9_9PSEU|nr:pyridoxal-phosphate dependent enzyme [Longimycelium tulufanense]GGM38914.1 threonine dehydratase [Longimycelium tulufanense]
MSHPELSLSHIEGATHVIDPIFRNTPQFVHDQITDWLGREVLLKVETVNPIRSFKGRGADFFLRRLHDHPEVVCATAGNFGQGLAYTARRLGVDLHVFTATNAVETKIERMRALGATVTLAGADYDASKDAALDYVAGCDDRIYVEDGREPEIAEGAGTIAIELLAAGPLDAVVVPVGNGALISGMGRWIKAMSPGTRVIGVCAAGAPAMERSWRTGQPTPTERIDTIADGIGVRVPIPVAVRWMEKVVDDVLLVDDEAIRTALRAAWTALGLVLEPAAVAGLAAIREHDISGGRIATILTGGNIRADLLASLNDR